ncbi:MAG: hypothetical protein ABI467_32190 [Kofleriaceae bacterium]
MRFTNLLFAVALIGCAKPSDTATLHDEAVATNNYYQPWVDALAKRGQAIVERGGKLGAAMPAGGEIASREISMAGQQLAELRNLTAPASDGTSGLVKQADAAAKDGNNVELQKLIDESQEKLGVGTRTIAEELNVAENWLARAEDMKAAAASPAAVAPTSPDTGGTSATGATGAPEAASGSGAAQP